MKTTILGGIFFLVPVAVLGIVIGKAYQFSLKIAAPLDAIIPITRFAGIAFVNILAVILILLVCFIAGLLVKRGLLGSRAEKLDGLLIDVIPGYAVLKGVLGSVAKEDEIAALMTPVLVKFDDYDQIAFEIESDDLQSVLFLPGSPSTWSGSTVVADKNRVHPLSIRTHQTVKLMRVLGRGTLALPTVKKNASAPKI